MEKVIRTHMEGSFFEYVFFCPGCECGHGFRTSNWSIMPTGLTEEYQELFKQKWTFNGDLEKPTITPSIHVWHKDGNGNRITKCHSFVTDGKIQYLGDCQHKLVGQTIELPEF